MDSLIKILFEAPVANFLIVAAIIFLLIAVGLKLKGKVEPDPRGRIWSGIFGTLLLFVGMGMHYWGSPSSTPPKRPAIEESKEKINIKETNEPDKVKAVSGKLVWNPGGQFREREIVIINGAPRPDPKHPVWDYVRNLSPPGRKGRYDWEAYSYKLFPTE